MRHWFIWKWFRARPLTFRLLGLGFASVGLLQLLYWHWPKGLCSDATYSVFAAQNAVAYGHLETIEPNVHLDSDLAKIKLQWLNSWPPMVSLLYAGLLKTGLTAGGATDWLMFGILLAGTWGWTLCMREAGISGAVLCVLALLIPWTSFPLLGMTAFYNDHLVWALAPWGFWLLLRLPASSKMTRLNFWIAVPVTALVCGLCVFAKYSALPVVVGAGIYFWFRDSWRLTASKLLHAAWFGFFLFMPGFVTFLLNRILSGQITAQVHGKVPLFKIGVAQIWNLLVSPTMELSGWSAILFHLHVGSLPSQLLSIPAMIITCAAFGYTFYLFRGAPEGRRFAVLALTMSASLWVFLLAITVLLGNQCDWTTQPRYSFPVAFAWLCLAIALILDSRIGRLYRSLVAVFCAIPLSAVLIAGVIKPFQRMHPVPLPKSHLAASPAEFAVYQAFQNKLVNAELARPDLIIAEGPYSMNEFQVSTVCWCYLEGIQKLRSSKPMVVWALLNDQEMAAFRNRLDKTVMTEQLNLPPNSPWGGLLVMFK